MLCYRTRWSEELLDYPPGSALGDRRSAQSEQIAPWSRPSALHNMRHDVKMKMALGLVEAS